MSDYISVYADHAIDKLLVGCQEGRLVRQKIRATYAQRFSFGTAGQLVRA